MKTFASFILFLALQTALFLHGNADPLTKLTSELEKKKAYDNGKLKRIAKLEALLKTNENLEFRYSTYLKLYDEFKSFNFDKAFNYARKLQEVGTLLNDPSKIAYGKVKLGFILLSSGMFKETFDSLKTVDVKLLSKNAKKEYYLITARTYYDLADFDKDNYYTSIYNISAGKYIDSAITLCSANSFENRYYIGLKFFKAGDKNKAILNLETLLDTKKHHLTSHQFAITASTLSDILIQNNQPDKAFDLLIQAAIADVKSSTKEAAAMVSLAQLLHQRGDIQNAYIFIRAAMDDANYYGARQRKIQVGLIDKTNGKFAVIA